jgi:hypothetical protein
MPTVTERIQSRRVRTGSNPFAEYDYIVVDAATESAADTAVRAAAPSTVNSLPLQAVELEPTEGEDLWYATVRYGLTTGGGAAQTGQELFSFRTGGGTQRITQSLETIQRYPETGGTPDADVPDYKGAIGVSGDTVEGVEIPVPVFEFSITKYFTDAQVTPTLRQAWFLLAARMNNATFQGFAAGELLFLGVNGARRGSGAQADWEITFDFAASQNQTGLAVGDITGISKLGWDYLWVDYRPVVDAGRTVLVPKYAFVERVFGFGDFSLLGLT